MEKIIFNNGNSIPAVGFGTFKLPVENTYEATLAALNTGYRHIDTAAAYLNEREVGEAIRDSGIPREEIFVTSKLWLQDYGYENAKKGIEKSLELLDLEYIDLYLLHQPYGEFLESWKALEEAVEEGKIKSIGISNVTPKIWGKYRNDMKVLPAVNQVEFNPLTQQKQLKEIMAKDDIKIIGWQPFGRANKEILENPIIEALAKKYGKNVGQIILRWIYQEGVVSIPQSTNPGRLKGNIEIFDFELSDEEMKELKSIDTGKGSHDPEDPSNEERLMGFKIHE